MDSDQQVYAFLSVLLEKIRVSAHFLLGSLRDSEIFCSKNQFQTSYRDRGYLTSFYHLSSLSSPVIELVCSYKLENQPVV